MESHLTLDDFPEVALDRSIEVDVGNKTYILRYGFRHDRINHQFTYALGRVLISKVFSVQAIVASYVAEARVHPNDTFSRKVGRKASFGKLIKGFPREVRTEFWNGFFNNEGEIF